MPTDAQPYPKIVRIFAKMISIVLHPLIVGVIIMGYFVFVHPSLFVGFDLKTKVFRFFTFVNNNFILPLLVVLLMRGLGFSKSIYLNTQKERIVPYVATIIFFFWTWYVFMNLPETPAIVVNLCQGMFFSSCVALILNNFFKISMHGIAMGGMLGVMMILIFAGEAFSVWPLLISLLLTAAVISARKIVTDHTWFEIAVGTLLGFAMQWLAWWL
jgi:hypothetical protein